MIDNRGWKDDLVETVCVTKEHATEDFPVGIYITFLNEYTIDEVI